MRICLSLSLWMYIYIYIYAHTYTVDVICTIRPPTTNVQTSKRPALSEVLPLSEVPAASVKGNEVPNSVRGPLCSRLRPLLEVPSVRGSGLSPTSFYQNQPLLEVPTSVRSSCAMPIPHTGCCRRCDGGDQGPNDVMHPIIYEHSHVCRYTEVAADHGAMFLT